MSNYLLLVHDRRYQASVDRWLSSYAGADEVASRPLGLWTRLVIVSKEIQKSATRHSYFRGFAITDDAIIYGAEAWRKAGEPAGSLEGTFVAAKWGRGAVDVSRDLFGNVKLLTTVGPGMGAVSDSLLVLGDLRRALGLRVTRNDEALYARSVLNLASAQVMSPDTMLEEVKVVPASLGVRLKAGAVEVLGQPFAHRMRSDLPYSATVRSAAARIAGIVSALDSTTWTKELNLSGGYDSRVIAAAVRATRAGVVFTSMKGSTASVRDYEVAQGLAAEFGVPFGRRRSDALPADVTADRLTLWGTSLAGIYDGFGPIRSAPLFPTTISMNGLGAGGAKGAWGWRTWQGFVTAELKLDKHTTERNISAFKAAGLAGILSVGGDPEADNATEMLYLAYRSGIHSSAGRIGLEMTNVSPLQSVPLMQLGHHVRSPEIITDLTILLDAEMAIYPYDFPERNLSRGYAETRLAELGGPVTRATPLKLLGDPGEVPAGPSQLGMNIARGYGFVGDHEDVMKWTDDDLDLLPSDLAKVYGNIAANGRWMTGKTGGNIRFAGPSPAKAASIRVLRVVT